MPTKKTPQKRRPGRPKQYEHHYNVHAVIHDKKLINEIEKEVKTKTLTEILTSRLKYSYENQVA